MSRLVLVCLVGIILIAMALVGCTSKGSPTKTTPTGAAGGIKPSSTTAPKAPTDI